MQKVLSEVEDSLAEQKLKGYRLVISEVDGSDDDNSEESDTGDKQSIADSLLSSDTGDKQSIADSLLSHEVSMPNGLESNSAEMADMLTKGETKPAWERPTERGEESTIPARLPHDRQEKRDQVMSDRTVSSDDTETVMSDRTVSCDETETVMSDRTVSNDDTETVLKDESVAITLPHKVARLKQEGNELFRSGQYAESIEKYTAGIAELSLGMFMFVKSADFHYCAHFTYRKPFAQNTAEFF